VIAGMVRRMVLEPLLVQIHIPVILKMDIRMAKENTPGKMGHGMMETGRPDCLMATGPLIKLMQIHPIVQP